MYTIKHAEGPATVANSYAEAVEEVAYKNAVRLADLVEIADGEGGTEVFLRNGEEPLAVITEQETP